MLEHVVYMRGDRHLHAEADAQIAERVGSRNAFNDLTNRRLDLRRRPTTLLSSASALLENMDRSACVRDGLVPGPAGAEPTGSIVEFAILSPCPELLRTNASELHSPAMVEVREFIPKPLTDCKRG